MAFLDSLGGSIKALVKGNVPFNSDGSYGSYTNVGFMPNGLINTGLQNASNGVYDPVIAAGDIGDNGVVAACIDAISLASSEATPFLEKRNGKDWAKVDDHPIIELLTVPNPNYGAQALWASTTSGECLTGSGYWMVRFDSLGPAQIWYEPAYDVGLKYSADRFVDNYVVKRDGKEIPVKAAANFEEDGGGTDERIVHFRYALNRRNPRYGWTPLSTVIAQIAGDKMTAIYHAALLQNNATPSAIVTPKEATSQITPFQLTEILQALEAKLMGRGAGRIAGSTLPIDMHAIGFSPDKLAIPELLGYYESRICASLKVPPMILGLASGDSQKTYANYGEAREDFVERAVLPTLTRRGDEIESQMFQFYPDLDRTDYRIQWDTSTMRALLEDQDALYKRLNLASGSSFMTPNEARAKIQLADVEGGEKLIQKAASPMGGDPSATDGSGKAIKTMEKETFGLRPDELELPELKEDMQGMEFTDEQIAALTFTASKAATALAFATATPEKLALIDANG